MSKPVQFLNLHIPQLDEVNDRLCSIEAQLGDFKQVLDAIQTKEIEMAKELDDLTAQVTANTTVEGSALTLIQGLAAQLAAAIASGNPAALTALQIQLKTSADALAAAVAANTAPAPPA